VKLKSDGLLSITKFDKIKCADSEMSDKDFYAYFRVGMKDCLKWPAYGWSLNKARKVCGNDDRLDILLDYLHTFYNLCEDYDGNLENFKNIISQELLRHGSM